jgi:hypothetical protein
VAEQVNFAGGGHMHIAADFVYCAWKTLTLGATSARLTAGDTVRIAKSAEAFSIGNATWTSTTTAGGSFSAAKNIVSSTNASPVSVKVTTHGFSTGDIIQILGHAVNTNANGAWVINKTDADNFTLIGSYGNGVGVATGTARLITSKAVVLDAARTAEVDRCEINWTANPAGDTTPSLVAYSTAAKEGGNCVKILLDAAVQINILQAYSDIYTHDTTVHDFSSYQYLSLWLRTLTRSPLIVGSWLYVRILLVRCQLIFSKSRHIWPQAFGCL